MVRNHENTRARPRAGAPQRGFTLLEVMVALAIMVSVLVWISQAHIDATVDTSRAKMMTVATMLARAKMNEIEFELMREGFSDFEEEECGAFDDESYGGLEKFKWCYSVEKIELPENLDLQRAFGLGTGEDGGESAESSGAPAPTPASPLMSMLGGMGGGSGLGSMMSGPAAGLIASQFGIIRNVIEQAIRRVNLTVSWSEGFRDKELVIVAYFTDPNVIERQIMGGMGGMGGAGLPTGGGSSGSKSSTSSGGTSSKSGGGGR